MCRKLKLVIACPRCLSSGNRNGAILRGQNDETDRVMKVACDHREMVFYQRAD
jgi:flagellar biosynthesis/type III secretory pathway chaperone